MKELRETIRNANLTKTQKMIAKYILDHSADACFMTSTEIALKLGVSESSVIRFSRSLGYSGFMDFQKALRKDYQDKVLSISSSITVPSQRIAKRAKLNDNAEYLKRHLKNSAKNLESILSTTPSRLLRKPLTRSLAVNISILSVPGEIPAWAIIFCCI